MPDLNKKTSLQQAMPIVHSFVELWNNYEAALQREIARSQKTQESEPVKRRKYSYMNYMLFYRVSNHLSHKKSLTMGELSNMLGVPLSTATRVADWLVSEGYINRLHDAEDRRIVMVTLTEKGNEMHHTIEIFAGERAWEILSCLTPSEQQTLFKLIGKVTSALEKAA
jgi:DNA-binding MarR family transcriptional regulator